MTAMTPKRFRRDAGVTLVEMMVVIVIIGLITAIVVVNVLPAQDTARLQKARADIRMLEQALELYRLDRARYPSTEEGLDALVAPPAADDASARTEPYIRALPDDPWGKPYVYVSPGAERAFDLFSYGADGQQGGEGRNADVGAAQ
jgi:general secretion pathway protein G